MVRAKDKKPYMATRYVKQSESKTNALTRYESSIKNKSIEHGALFDGNTIIEEWDGNRNHITINVKQIEKTENRENMVFTHNHPIDDSGEFQGVIFPLSEGDYEFFLQSGIKEIRAVNEKGHVFSFKRKPKSNLRTQLYASYSYELYQRFKKLESDEYYAEVPKRKLQAFAQHLFNKELAEAGKFEYNVEGLKDKDFFNG